MTDGIPTVQAKVVAMPSVEGSYGVVYAKGPYGWDAQGLAATELAAGVLNALESYFWASQHLLLYMSATMGALTDRIPIDFWPHRNTSEVPVWRMVPRLESMKNLD